MPDLRELSKRERRLLSTLSGIEKFVTNYETPRDEAQIVVRLQMLESACKEFYEVREKIELLLETTSSKSDDDESAKVKQEEENNQALTCFEDRCCLAKASLLSVQSATISTTSKMDQLGDHSGVSYSKVKLPEIRLPSFDGKIKEWVTFRDSFRSLIHENKQLTHVDRFSYLKSALSGEAIQEIESVEFSAVNYSVAWEALESRYENKKLIVKAHLDSLFAVEGLKQESYQGLNNLVGVYEKNLQMLQKIGEQTSGWSTILAHMVSSRLDPATLRQWETHHNSKEVPTYNSLITYLRSYCSVLQSVAPTKSNYSDQRALKPSVCHTVVKSSHKCPFCNEAWHSAFV
ncbi:uncharacterized protein LOC134210367 [Armigeres subalbatus]|uniref:uncharacterized protein LOC134210367 n=1 Tax=Armigeres subalbatus TaxID=124917 RepID=UPI002ED5B979